MLGDRHCAIAFALPLSFVLAGAVACGPGFGASSADGGIEPPPSSITISDLCGAEGPARIFPLEPNELLTGPMRFRDRLLVSVSELESEVSFEARPRTGPLLSRKLVSIDLCGGGREVVAVDLDYIYRPDDSGQPWLAHSHGEQLTWFDPTGQHPQRFVDAAGASPKHQRVGDQILLRANAGLLRVEFAPDGEQQVTELGEVGPDWVLTGKPGEADEHVVLALDEFELLEIDPWTGARVVLRREVHTFEVSSDGRFVILWPHFDEWDPPPLAERTRRLWDRERDVEIDIAAGMEVFKVQFGPGAVSAISSDRDETEIIFLDDLSKTRVRGEFAVRSEGADGSLLLSSGSLPQYRALYRLARDGSAPVLRGREGVQNRYVWAGNDAFWAVEQIDGSAPGNPPGAPYPGTHANVVRFAYDDFVSQTVVPQIWEPVMLAGQHWLGARNYGDSPVGELWLQTRSGEEILVDEDVFVDVNGYNPGPSFESERVSATELDESFLYLVVDEARMRYGLWRGAIQPGP